MNKLFILMLGVIFLIGMVSSAVSTTLNSPADNTIGISNVTFNCSATTTTYLKNISLFTNSTGVWHNNQTVTFPFSFNNNSATVTTGGDYILAKNISINNLKVLYHTNWMWTAQPVTSTANAYLTFYYTNGTGINTEVQSQLGNTPVMHTFYSPLNQSVDGTVKWIEVWLDSAYHGNDVYVKLDNTTLVTTNTSGEIFYSQLTSQNNLWNCYACDNSSVCSYAGANRTIGFDTIVNSISYNSTGYETGTESYILNITPTGYTPTNAKLVYNGTSYSITPTTSGGRYLLSKTLQIPSSLIGTNTFYYTWNISSTVSESSPTYTQTISPIQLGLCNATLLVPYINLTFKDESSDAWMNATIPSSTWVYYLGDGTVNKSFEYIQTTNQSNYKFCALPGDRTYYIDPIVSYKMGTDYPQRVWDPDLTSYTNYSLNKTLYLLNAVDGIYVTFQVIDVVGATIPNVEVTAERQFSGVWTLMETGITDSAGTTTFWLNPDFSTRLTFTKSTSVVADYTTTIFPSSSTYTITLGSSVNNTAVYYDGSLTGMVWKVTPSGGTLKTNTLYDFSFAINSTQIALTGYKMELMDKNAVVFATVIGTGINGSTISLLNVNTLSNETIRARLSINVGSGYVIIDDDSLWPVFDEDIPERGTIKAFLKHISEDKIFGDNIARREYSRFVFFFLILFIVMGFLSYTTGWDVQTAGGSMLLLVPIVWMASAAGIFNISYALSACTTALFPGEICRETIVSAGFISKYMIAFIVTLFAGGYMLSQLTKERQIG